MDRLARLAPLSGLFAAVLFSLGNALWAFEQPDRDAGTAELVAFYEDTSTEILIGGPLSLVSILFFVWFGAVLRERLEAAEGRKRSGLPLMAFGGAVLVGAVGLGAETINGAGALAAEDGQLNGDTAQIYFDVSYALGAPAAGVAAATVAAPIAVVALRTGAPIHPRAAWPTLLLALLLLSPLMLTPAFGYVFGAGILLLAALSVQLYRSGPG